MQRTTKPWRPVSSGTERVHDKGGGSGQLGLVAAAVHYSRDRYHVCWCKRGRSLGLKLYIDAVYSEHIGTKAQWYNI